MAYVFVKNTVFAVWLTHEDCQVGSMADLHCLCYMLFEQLDC
jgi:hypothetical protein